MKSKKTLVLAGSILALTLWAFPHDAVAGTTTTPQQAGTDMSRASGDSKLKYMAVILAAGNLISLLVP